MNSQTATNFLLIVIAFLLLVQVIQEGMTEGSSYSPSYSSAPSPQYSSSPRSAPATRNPTVKSNVTSMAHAMYGQALLAFPEGCGEARVLGDCDSPAAQAVKSQIDEWAGSGLGPRQVFDKIVESFGEEVLTPQAQQIRNARLQSSP